MKQRVVLGMTAAVCLVCSLLATPARAEGRFVVLEPDIESHALRADVAELHDSGLLQSLVDEINRLFVIPRDVGVRFAECGEANAYFYESEMQISMCVELLAEMEQDFSQVIANEDERDEAVAGAFTAILLHEVGHALVSVLEIPITGREEDAVDQLSAWVLIEGEMADAVLSSAATNYSNGGQFDPEALADEHSLDQQRYFNMVCWVYGSDPATRASLIADWELPEARAERCADEYELLRYSWARLPDGHLRASGG